LTVGMNKEASDYEGHDVRDTYRLKDIPCL
jgi:hypothetical protein